MSDECEQLCWLNVDYDNNKRIYHKHTKALAKVWIKIQQTVDQQHYTYTNAATTHVVMVKLHNQFKQTDHT